MLNFPLLNFLNVQKTSYLAVTQTVNSSRSVCYANLYSFNPITVNSCHLDIISLTTSLARINPATGGTNGVLPKIFLSFKFTL